MATGQNNRWSSSWNFILAATGSAVGLGNIWRFPYISGENGGGAFVIAYLICIFCLGLPTLIAEIMIGRIGRKSPTECFTNIAIATNSSKNWQSIGFMGMLASFCLLSFYSVIAGIAADYALISWQNGLGASSISSAAIYQAICYNPLKLLTYSSVFLVITGIIVAKGINRGLEKSIRFMVPFLFIILIFLVAYALITTNSFNKTLNYLFIPRWNEFNSSSFLVALGQALFTLSIATASMLIYGCYIKENTSLFKTAATIACFDTIAAMLAGLAIFPFVFEYQLTPQDGPALVFKALPIAFATMPQGNLIGCLFFLLLLAAALSSAISMVEPIVAWIVEKNKCSRIKAAGATIFLIWILSLGSLLSLSYWENIKIIGNWNFLQTMDALVSLLLMPLGALLMTIFAGWIISKEQMGVVCKTNTLIFNVWRFAIRYLVPTAIIAIVFFS